MATFLTTRRMSPELVARVEASVRGRRALPGTLRRPRSAFLFRISALTAIIVCIGWIVLLRHRAREELERDRAALLQRVRQSSVSLTASEKARVSQVRAWLERALGDYPGDWLADELGSPGALGAILERGIVYIRGPLTSFHHAAGFRESAASSVKDALVLCLVDPPSSRTEKSLLVKVRAAYAFGERMRESTRHVERLHYAIVGLPFLDPTWEQRVLVGEQRELERLAKAFDAAPMESAKRAAKANVLLFAVDEPADAETVAELDGERARFVRVGLVDLAASKLLLRLRRRVDPGWLSAAVRAEYASGMNGCALALDTHEAVRAAGAAAQR